MILETGHKYDTELPILHEICIELVALFDLYSWL